MVEVIKKEDMILSSKIRIVVEWDHPSAWDSSSSADQVFNAAAREAENHLMQLLLEHGERRYRFISCEPIVTMAKRKEK